METYPWWTEKHKKLAQEAKEFVDEFMPLALEYGWKKEYPWGVIKEIAKKGWYGAMIPEKYGGRFEDWGVTGACILCEEIGRMAAPSNSFSNTMCNGGTHQIAHAGNEEQKQRWLPRVAKGELQGCITMTEPYTGSDAAAMETAGTRQGDVYIVHGKKRFITNSGAGNLYMTYVKTSDQPEDRAKYKHLTALVIEKGTQGFTIERQNDLTGLDGMYNGYLDFDNAPVPVANRLGEEGEGWDIMTRGLNPERTVVAAIALGRMREALRYSVYHMQRRVQFGQPTINIPTNQFKVADMVMELNIARLLTYYTAYLCDLGLDTAAQASIVKLFNTETFMRSFILDAIQCMGGDGVSRLYPVERHMRDAKVYELAGGTSEVMRLIIYRQGLSGLTEDLKVPRRVMHQELNVPFPAGKEELPKFAVDEAGVLDALAENYRVNPGLHLTLQELKEQVAGTEEELTNSLTSLETQGLAKLQRDRKGAINLARATYDGLAKARPLADYHYFPAWVREEDMF